MVSEDLTTEYLTNQCSYPTLENISCHRTSSHAAMCTGNNSLNPPDFAACALLEFFHVNLYITSTCDMREVFCGPYQV